LALFPCSHCKIRLVSFIPGSPCGSRRVYFHDKSVYTDRYRR
jgi:hypothetical protein